MTGLTFAGVLLAGMSAGAVELPRWVNVAPLPAERAEELAADQRWLFNHTPMDSVGYICTLVPESTPAFDKAAVLAPRFREQKRLLTGAKGACGLLFQATMGHGWTPDSEAPFTRLVKGDGSVPYIFCPLDAEFLAYIRRQTATLVRERPDFVMVDDDTRMYASRMACFCPLHLAEFARRTGRTYTRETLQAEIATNATRFAEWDSLLRDSIAGLMKVVREEMDKVDPKMPGLFCCCAEDVHHGAHMAKILAAPGQRPVVRLNNGRYCSETARDFASWLRRTAMEIAVLKSEGCVVLDEPDTCPQNRYSMSAADLLAHITLAMLEGCDGGKFWITRTNGAEPASGRAYREVLERNAGYLRAVNALGATWEGVGVPLPRAPYTRKNIVNWTVNWGGNLLGRLGIPFTYSPRSQAVNAIGPDVVRQPILTEANLRELLAGKLLVEGEATLALTEKGYGPQIGFTAEKWSGPRPSFEATEDGGKIGSLYNAVAFKSLARGARARSEFRHRAAALASESEPVGPGVVDYVNAEGGRVLSFASSFPPWLNHSWFGFYNEVRKRQLVALLTDLYGGKLPFAYYPEDGEVMLKWGRAKDGRRLMAAFVSGHDDIENFPVVFPSAPKGVSRLMSDGSWQPVEFETGKDGVTRLKTTVRFLRPAIFTVQ